jgi:hypothetical protein
MISNLMPRPHFSRRFVKQQAGRDGDDRRLRAALKRCDAISAENVMTKHVTTVNPDQNTTYYLANNPIDFGTGTNINVSSGSGIGVYGSSAQSWSVTNQGAISGHLYGVDLTVGGSVTNKAGATISGGYDYVVHRNGFTYYFGRGGCVRILGGAGMLTNAGTITTSGKYGVHLGAGGSVTNEAGGTISGYFGVKISGGAGMVTNAGTISGSGGYGGVSLSAGGSVANEAGGTISGPVSAVTLFFGGAVTNAGKISGARNGVSLYFDGGSLINEAGGIITCNTTFGGTAVSATYGDTVTNQAGATISAYGPAAGVGGGALVVQNYGNIVSTGYGVNFWYGGGVVNNFKGGTISGANDVGHYDGAVRIVGGSPVVTNAGAISVKVGVYMNAYTGGAETVTNAGTISGTKASVQFAGSGANTLTLETGSTLIGDAIGSTASGATNALVLEGHGTANNNFDNFNTLNVQANANWTLGGSSTFGATTVSSGTLIVAGDLTGGATTLGDAAGDLAQLAIASTGAWNILGDSGIGLGGPAPSSSMLNSGLIEKTGGSGTSAIAPQLVNKGAVLVSSGTLDLQGAVGGNGADTISGASTLEFDSTVGGGQTAGFTGSGGTLDLIDPSGFAAKISGFAAPDKVELSGDWVFSHFSETGNGNMGTLTLTSGSNQLSLNFLGDYTKNDFTIASGATTTTITHT